MFESFLKRTDQAAVEERLESVEFFNGLIQERAEVRGKVDTLSRGLERAEARLAEIPHEQQNIRDDHYRAHVKRELDPSLPDRTDLTNQELKSLADERGDLQGQAVAYREALNSTNQKLGKLEGEHGSVERARRAAWEAIAERLVARVPSEFQQQFLEIWTALDRVRDGIPAEAALSKIVSIELSTETKMRTIEQLCHEFEMTIEW